MAERLRLAHSDIPGMTPVTLNELEQAGLARIVEVDHQLGIEFTISPKWPYKNETRIGDASIGRLFECVRELHWQQDVVSVAGTNPVDCATVASNEEFKQPVTAQEKVIGQYRVLRVGSSSYGLEISLTSPAGSLLSRTEKTFAFFNASRQKSTNPPVSVKENLERLRFQHSKAK